MLGEGNFFLCQSFLEPEIVQIFTSSGLVEYPNILISS